MDAQFYVRSGGQIDLQESYLKFYVHKAKFEFPMKWKRSFDVPKRLKPAFAHYFPDQPVVTERRRKRSREEEEEKEEKEEEKED